MKKVIAILTLTLAAVFTVSAQTTQTDNAGSVSYVFLRENVKANQAPVLKFNRNTDSHGFSASYTRFFAGKGTGAANTLGAVGEVSANFDSKSSASLVTAMVGVTAEARNAKFIQPFARVLVGVARQNVTLTNLKEVSDSALAYDLGGGFDFNLAANSRYKVRTGFDYLNTRFVGQRQNGARLQLGLVF